MNEWIAESVNQSFSYSPSIVKPKFIIVKQQTPTPFIVEDSYLIRTTLQIYWTINMYFIINIHNDTHTNARFFVFKYKHYDI